MFELHDFVRLPSVFSQRENNTFSLLYNLTALWTAFLQARIITVMKNFKPIYMVVKKYFYFIIFDSTLMCT